MEATTFNVVDLVVLAIIGLSIFVGVVRGVTREVLGIAAWIGAFVTVFYGLPFLRPIGRKYIENHTMADGVIAILLFILSLGVFILISRTISTRIKISILGGIDRSLGLVFGFLRGILVVCLLYIAINFFFPPDEIPDVFKTAKSTSYLELGANELKRLVPKYYLPQDISKKNINPLDAADLLEHTIPTLEETVKNLSTLKPTSPKKPETEYSEKDKQDLNKLIEENETTTQR
jgi:membrane protein required for colicin V production